MRWAVEVRDATWLHDDVYAVLERHGAALCIHDLLPPHPWNPRPSGRTSGSTARATADPYHGRYGGRRLWRSGRSAGRWLDEGVDVYAYFNNDYNGDAVADAQWLDDRLGGALVADLLGEVVRVADLAIELELGLEPVGVLFLAFEDVLEQVAAAVVALVDAERDAAVEALDRVASRARGRGCSCSGTVSPTRTVPSRCRLGTPSRYRMRSISSSASFISSIDSSRKCLPSRS